VLCGLMLDWVYRTAGIVPSFRAGESHEHGAVTVAVASAIVLSAFILYHSGRKLARRLA